MSERGMGAAVGQVPEYIEMVTRWCKQYSRLPVIVKLTPNITDIRKPAQAAKKGGADAVSLINTINSIMGVDPYTLTMSPSTGGKGSHGGYCGPAVKPIALNMVAEIARDPQTAGLPISGIGGIGNWRDALDFIALGSGTVQVCTAAMVYGFKIVQDMESGLSNYMDEMGFTSVGEIVGKAIPTVTNWQYLNLNHISKAVINQDSCIQCGRCHIACEDTSHQAITFEKEGKRHFEVKEDECVGCNLCVTVCPVPDTITLPLVFTGLLFNCLSNQGFAPFQDSIIGAILGYTGLWLLNSLYRALKKQNGIGMGDAKLLAALGAWLGWQPLPSILLIASLTGLIGGLIWLAWNKQNHRTAFPFGPFLAIAGIIELLWPQTIQTLLLSKLA